MAEMWMEGDRSMKLRCINDVNERGRTLHMEISKPHYYLFKTENHVFCSCIISCFYINALLMLQLFATWSHNEL